MMLDDVLEDDEEWRKWEIEELPDLIISSRNVDLVVC